MIPSEKREFIAKIPACRTEIQTIVILRIGRQQRLAVFAADAQLHDDDLFVHKLRGRRDADAAVYTADRIRHRQRIEDFCLLLSCSEKPPKSRRRTGQQTARVSGSRAYAEDQHKRRQNRGEPTHGRPARAARAPQIGSRLHLKDGP